MNTSLPAAEQGKECAAPTLTLRDYMCVFRGPWGLPPGIRMGWDGKGFWVGTRDHSCPEAQVSARVSLRIQEA